ncbi:MAG: cytochrome oxidase putative small subunit CydP [Methylocystis sp.]
MKKCSLGREISLALTLKVAAIAVLYYAFFSGPHRPHVTPQSVAALISAPMPATR